MRNRTGQRQSRGDRRVEVAAVSRWGGSESSTEGRAGMLRARAVQEEGADKEEVLQGKSVPGAGVCGIGTLLRERLLSGTQRAALAVTGEAERDKENSNSNTDWPILEPTWARLRERRDQNGCDRDGRFFGMDAKGG